MKWLLVMSFGFLLALPVVAFAVWTRVATGEETTYGDDDRPRVLLVGNSFFREHDLAAMVGHLSESSGAVRPLSVTSLTRDGATLTDFASRWLVTRRFDDGWRTVVLHGEGFQAVTDYAGYVEAGTSLAAGIRRGAARPILYTTAAYRADEPRMTALTSPVATAIVQDVIMNANIDVARRSGATVSFGGAALSWCEHVRPTAGGPTKSFYADDGIHPSLLGSYLMAWAILRLADEKVPAPDGPWWKPDELTNDEAAWIRRCASDAPRFGLPPRPAAAPPATEEPASAADDEAASAEKASKRSRRRHARRRRSRTPKKVPAPRKLSR
ncbi:MAG: hypothetical protein R3A78_07680 [Polyangiales bacterium]|nr:hypothetical protein [Myxococcales bacterium]